MQTIRGTAITLLIPLFLLMGACSGTGFDAAQTEEELNTGEEIQSEIAQNNPTLEITLEAPTETATQTLSLIHI